MTVTMVEFVNVDLSSGLPTVDRADQRRVRVQVMKNFRRHERLARSQQHRQGHHQAIHPKPKGTTDRGRSNSSAWRKQTERPCAILPGVRECDKSDISAVTKSPLPKPSSLGPISVYLANDVDLVHLNYWFWMASTDNCAAGGGLPDRNLQAAWHQASLSNELALDTITAHAFLRSSELTRTTPPAPFYMARLSMIRRVKGALITSKSDVSATAVLTMGLLAWLDVRAGERDAAMAHVKAMRQLCDSRLRIQSSKPGVSLGILPAESMAVSCALHRAPQLFREPPIPLKAFGADLPDLDAVLDSNLDSRAASQIRSKASSNVSDLPASGLSDIEQSAVQRLFICFHALDRLGSATKGDSVVPYSAYGLLTIHDHEITMLQAQLRARTSKDTRAIELLAVAAELRGWIGMRPRTSLVLREQVAAIFNSVPGRRSRVRSFADLWRQSGGNLTSLVWVLVSLHLFAIRTGTLADELCLRAEELFKHVLGELQIRDAAMLQKSLQAWPALREHTIAEFDLMCRRVWQGTSKRK
jgi:hypothetical protein